MRDYYSMLISSATRHSASHCQSINLITKVIVSFWFMSTFLLATTAAAISVDENVSKSINISIPNSEWHPPKNFEYVTPIIQTQILKRKCRPMHVVFPGVFHASGSVRNITISRPPAFHYVNIGTPMYKNLSEEEGQLKVKSHRGRICLKCPGEKTMVASKYEDGVLIDGPKLHSCAGHILSPSQYTLDTLFSQSFRFGLPQGTHSFIGRIRNARTNEIEKVCTLRYKVVVQKCTKFRSPDENLRVFCDMGNVWGSKCRFGCKNNGKLSHNRPIYCNDELKWSGEPPICKYAKPKSLDAKPFNPEQSCELPVPPTGTKFSCKTPVSGEKLGKYNLYVPEGTVCRLKCIDDNASKTKMPKKRTNPYFCWDGHWNATINRRLEC